MSEIVRLAPVAAKLRGTGMLDGRIAEAPRGSEGFGYDPVFVPDGEERTVAELGDEWKRGTRTAHARCARSWRRSRVRARNVFILAAAVLTLAGCGDNDHADRRVLATFFAKSPRAPRS